MNLYSVIIPVFNSEKTILKLTDGIIDVFKRENILFEIILVNDASIDGSWNEIIKIKKRNPNVIIGINLIDNVGQHNATLEAIEHCKGMFVITIDDDLQNCPKDIISLINKQKETNANVVYGIPFEKNHSKFRKIGSKVVLKIFSVFALTPPNLSSFRVVKKSIFDKVKLFNNKYVVIDEVISWFSNNKYDSVFVTHSKRDYGESGYKTTKLALWAIRIIITYTSLPSKIIGVLGFFTLIFTLMTLLNKIIFNVNYELILISSIFLSLSIILISLKCTFMYFNRIFNLTEFEQKKIVAEVLN